LRARFCSPAFSAPCSLPFSADPPRAGSWIAVRRSGIPPAGRWRALWSKFMNADQIWGIARAVLAAIGGYFVAKGTITADWLNTFLGGAGTIFVAVWSVLSKK
jgi:hypothetical protein